MSSTIRRTLAIVLALTCAAASWPATEPARAAEPQTYVWLEAEEAESVNFDHYTGFDRAHLLSGRRLVGAVIEPQTYKNEMPPEGYRLSWTMRVPESGTYQAWARVGMQQLRAPFDWRIDDGEWRHASNTAPTTSLMELKEWNDVSWQHLGDLRLNAGEHSLTVRYTEPGSNQKMHIMLDCFAFTLGRFVPEGYLKPGEKYDSQQDRAAAQKVYRLPEPTKPAARRRVELTGLWQVARYDDPDMDSDTFVPVSELPSPDVYPLRWMGIDVPKSLWQKDETIFAHRVIYRTRVDVPAGYRGRGFKLHFGGTNLIASVFVNGKFAGSRRSVWIPWDIDVSEHVRPGEINEVAVAIKGPYYAVDVKNYGGADELDEIRNRPRSRQDWVYFVEPIYPSTKGDGNGVDYGIVNPVTFIAVGDAYTEDVFVKPGLDRHGNNRLVADVTVRNAGDAERTFEVRCQAVYDADDSVEKSFEPAQMTVPPGETRTISVGGPWQDPKLWWPEPNPHLYRLRTTVSEGGTPLDVQEELFGFRWISIKGTGLYINGVRRNFWNWVGVQGQPWSTDEWLKQFRAENNRFTRFSMNRKISKVLRSREERLEFFDRNGIAGRLCSMIDGMFINRVLGNRTSNPVTGERWLDPNWPVWEGFARHLDQLTRAYRNHPSVILYQVENELVYITGMNIYGAYLDRVCDLMNDAIEVARSNDPTRPYTVGGAGDLLGRLEINGPHYPRGSHDWYPENAYTLQKFAPKHEHWPWKRQKPWQVGESAFANHLEFASITIGDRAFRGAEAEKAGKAKYLRMLYGGYRWAEVSAWFPWDNLHGYEDAEKIFSDLCVIPRRQTSRLYGGRRNEMLFKVMNDTLSREPVTFEWSYEAEGGRIAAGKNDIRIEPGFGREQTLVINAPETDRRLEGTLKLKVSQPGADDYVDERPVPVLPTVDAIDVEAPIALFDPAGRLKDHFSSMGVEFQTIDELAKLEGRGGLLLVGPDALSPKEAFGRELLKFAAAGGQAIVLEQEVPAAGSNLPTPLRATTHYGGYAHPKALGTPVFRDLGELDLIDWTGGHPTFKNPYDKPAGGARILAECGPKLPWTPLVQMPVGQGVIVACQLRVGAHLGTDPAADVLLRNLVEHYADYTPPTGVAAIYAPDDPLMAEKIDATGMLNRAVDSVDAALQSTEYRVAVIHATQANLKELNRLKEKAGAFQEAGGWIMLCGLGREGIDEYNALLGTGHMIRPFRLERVTLENPQFPLAATLGNRDVALYSPERLQHSTIWISDNTFSAVVDGRDVAPFTIPPEADADALWRYEPTRNDHDPYNFVNGMLGSDHWRYIRQIWLPEEGPQPLVFRFWKPATVERVRVWNNANYWTIEDLDVIVDGDEDSAVTMTLPDGAGMRELVFEQPRLVEQSITLQIKSWRVRRPDRPDMRLVGIDNVEFLRPQPPQGAVFLDSEGGLVAYPRGDGGVFLNQIKWMQDEPNPENVGKKLNVTSTILQNMGVGSAASTVALPGVNVRYEPVNLLHHGTQFLRGTEERPGWFGERGLDMKNLPVGERMIADVLYHIVDYDTAPVADCIVLGAHRAPQGMPKTVKGIEVHRKADLLFFLHTARVTRPLRDDERRRSPYQLPEVLRYVIHYADGQTHEVPVRLGAHIDHWLQENPVPLQGALVSSAVPVPRAETHQKGVLYSMQVRNPRPHVEIESIDVSLGQETRRAVPAVLGITTGTVLR